MRPNVLFATSEAFPLAKTGGLGDVSASLPSALHHLGVNVRLVLPAYRSAVQRLGACWGVSDFSLPGSGESVRIIEGVLPGTDVPVWLVDMPRWFERNGGPYLSEKNQDWPDNAQRFAAFARAVVELACGRGGIAWTPDVVHCNDWQTGLVPALLQYEPSPPATVFTVHNLAYQGLFPHDTFHELALPPSLWGLDGLEFYGQLSFIKGGLVFGDRLTTVSPTYAREILEPEQGGGLDGLLRHRSRRLAGILNGADYTLWNPATDVCLDHHFSSRSLAGKAMTKRQLQRQIGLSQSNEPLLGLVGRLVEQKGLELLIDVLPQLLRRSLQLVILGKGEARFERLLQQAAASHPRQLAFVSGYDERLAHRIEAGADMFLMPSLYEPCGLNQIYSLRYGTIPIVHGVGGLADTVVDASLANLKAGTATGLVFAEPTPVALITAVDRALGLYGQPNVWAGMIENAMAQDFSWTKSAQGYLDVYQSALADRAGSSRPVSVSA